MNINDARDALYTNPITGDDFPATFFHYCDQSGTKDEQGGYALIVYTLLGEVAPSVRIVERERVTFA